MGRRRALEGDIYVEKREHGIGTMVGQRGGTEGKEKKFWGLLPCRTHSNKRNMVGVTEHYFRYGSQERGKGMVEYGRLLYSSSGVRYGRGMKDSDRLQRVDLLKARLYSYLMSNEGRGADLPPAASQRSRSGGGRDAAFQKSLDPENHRPNYSDSDAHH